MKGQKTFLLALLLFVLIINTVIISWGTVDQERGNKLKLKRGDLQNDVLDFFVMGFPKCGTTSLLTFFNEVVNETRIVFKKTRQSPSDPINYSLEYPLLTSDSMETLIDSIRDTSEKFPSARKFGIKWPTAVDQVSAVRRLIDFDQRHDQTKLIIGLRHPVRWFESFYNFRVRASFRLKTRKMPPTTSLIGNRSVAVNQLYTGMAQYERFLMQFGKVDLSPSEIQFLSTDQNMRLLAIPNKIFVFTVEQLSDDNRTRSDLFLSDLSSFMNLETRATSDMMTHSNAHIASGENDSIINICDHDHIKVREVLLRNAKPTMEWILNRLTKASDVTLGGKDYFLSIVQTWATDPCETST